LEHENCMVERNRYQKALDMTLALSKERLRSELVALYLSGSYLRGDFIHGWSDIDITAVVKDEVLTNESSKRQFFQKCKAICEEVEKAYPGVKIDLGNPLGTTSESVVRQKSNLSLFLLRQQQKMLFGRDILKEAPILGVERIPEWGKAATLWLCDHFLEILQAEQISEDKNLVKSARWAITDVMKIAQNSLFIKGIVKLRKEDVAESFENEFASFEFKDVVRQALQLQSTWEEAERNSKKLIDFIGNAKKFTQALKKTLT